MGLVAKVQDRRHTIAAAGHADTASGPRAASWAGRAHGASLLLAYPVLLWLGRDMWFRLDEWRIVLGHTAAAGPRWFDVFAPFDVHWSTVLVLFYRGVGVMAGARDYLPYMGVALAVHVLSVHMLWRVLRRIGVDPWVATLSACAVLVLGAAWEAMYWVLILGYTLPLVCTFGAVLLGDRAELHTRHRLAIAALTVAAVMCSGAGVAMIVTPAVVVALRRGVRDGLSVVAPAAAVYAVWLALAGSGILDHPGGASRGQAFDVMRFVWDGVSASVAALVGPTLLGALLLLLVCGWAAVRWRRVGMPAPVPACAAGAVAMFALTALGRANGGAATLPHYLSTGVMLLMPAMALAASDAACRLGRVGRVAAGRAIVFAGLAIVTAHSAATLVAAAHDASTEDQQSRRVILAAAALSRQTQVLPDSVPEPHLAWAVSGADIVRLRDRGDLPPAATPPALAAEVRLRVHVAISTAPAGGAAPSQLALTDAVEVTLPRPAPGCVVVRGTTDGFFVVAVTFDTPGELHITAVSPVSVHAFLRGTPAAPADEVQPMVLLPAGDSRWLDDVEPGSSVLLRFTSGVVRLCP